LQFTIKQGLVQGLKFVGFQNVLSSNFITDQIPIACAIWIIQLRAQKAKSLL